MRFIIVAFILFNGANTFSYVKYNMRRKNYMAAVGAAIVGATAILLPGYVLLVR